MQQYYLSARNYEKAGDHKRAAEEYRAFLGEALHRIANGKAQAGEIDAAMSLFDAAANFLGGDSNLLLDYASACLSVNNLAKAKDLAEKAVAIDPKSERSRFLLGRILFDLGDYEGAKVQLQVAVARNPDFDTGYLLGKTYLSLHDVKAAGALFAKMAAGLGDTALIHIYFGRAYTSNDYFDLAIEEFKKAIVIDRVAPNAHYHLALAYLGDNEEAGYDKAIPELKAELKINPNDFSSHYMLGYIAMKQRNFAESERELNRALELSPQDVGTMLQLAVVFNETNRPPEAEAILRKAAAVSEASPMANSYAADRVHYMLGQSLAKSGRQEESQKELKIYAAREKERQSVASSEPDGSVAASGSLLSKENADQPERKDLVRAAPGQLNQLNAFVKQLSPAIAEAYNNLGAMAAEEKNLPAAVEYFQDAAEWNPSLEGVDRNLGGALFYSGQFEKATASLERFLRGHPQDAQARSMLSMSLFQSEEFQRVISTLDSQPSLMESNSNLAYIYAVSLVKTQKYSAGIERLRALQSANPNSPQIQNALAEALAAEHASGDTGNAQK